MPQVLPAYHGARVAVASSHIPRRPSMCHSHWDMTDRDSKAGDSAARLRAIAERLDPSDRDDGPEFADEEEVTLVEVPQSMSPSKVVLGTVLAIPPSKRAGLMRTLILSVTLLIFTAILSDRLPGWMKWLLSFVSGAPKP